LVLAQSHCVTHLFIDASREVDEGNKSDDSSDNEFPNEEQEVSHLVKNCHPYHISEYQAKSLLCGPTEIGSLRGGQNVGIPEIFDEPATFR